MRTQSVDLHKLKAAIEAAGDTNAGTLVDRRRKLIAEAQAVLTEIETLDDEFTEPEKSAIDAAGKSLEALDRDIARFTKSAQVVANFDTASTEGRSGRLNLKAGAAEVARKMADPYGEKALLDAGSAVTSVPLDSTVYEQGRVGTNALDVLPFKQRGSRYSYFRQTTRDNHAAPVAPGALKPTSSYGLTSIDGKLEVIAHGGTAQRVRRDGQFEFAAVRPDRTVVRPRPRGRDTGHRRQWHRAEPAGHPRDLGHPVHRVRHRPHGVNP